MPNPVTFYPQLPSVLTERVVEKRDVSPQFWRVSMLDSVLLLSVFRQVIIQPLLGRMGEDTKAQVYMKSSSFLLKLQALMITDLAMML